MGQAARGYALSGLEQLEARLGGLLSKLEPAARRGLAREIAKGILQSQRKRISSQQNPDGSAYVKRKPQLRQKAGRIRRQMFSKLRTTRFLKSAVISGNAVVGFIGQVERIARVHQLGLRDRVQKGGRETQYPVRELLGFTEADVAAVQDLVIDHLAL